MKKLNLLTVAFNTKIQRRELPGFRGAIAAKVGLENDLFHNHDNSVPNSTKRFYRYPRIQYKYYRGKLLVVCLNEGVEAMHHFFSKPTWTLLVYGQPRELAIHRLTTQEKTVEVLDENKTYVLKSWLALNPKNWAIYQRSTVIAKIQLLEKILASNIVVFAKGIDWKIDKRFEVEIMNMPRERKVSYKNQQILAFDLSFKINMELPDYIGIGNGVSLGHGMVVRKKSFRQ